MVVVEAKNVSFSYGSDAVLRDVTLKASPGKVLTILGPNGSGKTTLLKLLAGILKPSSGKILFDGTDTREMDRDEIAKIVGYSPQENVIPGILTVYEVVLLGRIPYLSWKVSKDDLKIVSEILKELGLEAYAKRYANQLSGGERQLVLIAQVLAREPSILLLDEPVSNLDIRNQLEILDIIREITRQREITTITVLHDLNLAIQYSDKVVVLNSGRVYAEGGPESVITEETIRNVYGVDAKISTVDGIIQVTPISPAQNRSRRHPR